MVTLLLKDPKTVVNDYSASKDVVKDLKKLDDKVQPRIYVSLFFCRFLSLVRVNIFNEINDVSNRVYADIFIQFFDY